MEKVAAIVTDELLTALCGRKHHHLQRVKYEKLVGKKVMVDPGSERQLPEAGTIVLVLVEEARESLPLNTRFLRFIAQ